MPPTKGGMLPAKGGRGSGKGKKAASAKGAPNKSGGPKPSKKKVKKPKSHEWATYIHRTLKQLQRSTKLSISSRSMTIIGSFVEDIFDRLHSEAVNIAKMSKRKTLSAREMQTSTRLFLPGDLAKHAMSEGTKAVSKYNSAVSSAKHSANAYFEFEKARRRCEAVLDALDSAVATRSLSTDLSCYGAVGELSGMALLVQAQAGHDVDDLVAALAGHIAELQTETRRLGAGAASCSEQLAAALRGGAAAGPLTEECCRRTCAARAALSAALDAEDAFDASVALLRGGGGAGLRDLRAALRADPALAPWL